MTDFKIQLKTRAGELNLPLAEVARRAGISDRRIGHYASGRSEPDLQTLVKIANAVGTTPDGLLLAADKLSDGEESDRDRLLAQISAACGSLNFVGLKLIASLVAAAAKETSLAINRKER